MDPPGVGARGRKKRSISRAASGPLGSVYPRALPPPAPRVHFPVLQNDAARGVTVNAAGISVTAGRLSPLHHDIDRFVAIHALRSNLLAVARGTVASRSP